MNKTELTRLLNTWSHCLKILVAHEDSPDYIIDEAKFVGSTAEILEYCKKYTGNYLIIYVAGPSNLVYGLKLIQPNATIWNIDDKDSNI